METIKSDSYTNYHCVDGHCPKIIEEEKYGLCTSTCDDYCGRGFKGCHNCWFEGDEEVCNACIHKED